MQKADGISLQTTACPAPWDPPTRTAGDYVRPAATSVLMAFGTYAAEQPPHSTRPSPNATGPHVTILNQATTDEWGPAQASIPFPEFHQKGSFSWCLMSASGSGHVFEIHPCCMNWQLYISESLPVMGKPRYFDPFTWERV